MIKATLLAALLAGSGSGLAAPPEGKGPNKGSDDGGNVGPAFEYDVRHLDLPEGFASNFYTNSINETRAVGYFTHASGEKRGWVYDPLLLHPTQAVDLNSEQVGLVFPPGHEDWIIASAVGINDLGAVVGYISPPGDTSIRRGYVLDLLADPLVLHTLPDEFASDTYARRINNHGEILGTFYDEFDGERYSYVYNSGIYGEEPGAIPTIIDIPLNGGSPSEISERTESGTYVSGNASAQLGYPAFRYTFDGTVNGVIEWLTNETFEGDVTAVRVFGINGSGTMCGILERIVPLKGNKYTRQTVGIRYASQVEELGPASFSSINNDGDILTISSNMYRIFHDDYGWLEEEFVIDGSPRVSIGERNPVTNFPVVHIFIY